MIGKYIEQDQLYINEFPQPMCEISQGNDVIQIHHVETARAIIESLQKMIAVAEKKL